MWSLPLARLWVQDGPVSDSVFIAPTPRVFHARVDCHRLQIARSFTAVDIDQVSPRRLPCQSCIPSAPRVKFLKRFCIQCNKDYARPCAHNGGVKVMKTVTTTYFSALREPGDTFLRSAYVWPDRAHLYQKA